MTTKKDLVEAHAFSRRRLVTAFLSGAPGGREVEPTRPGRTILGGVALAVLVVAGGAVAHELVDKPESGWDQQGLVVTDRGSRYVVTRDKQPLRPVVNLTSAQLILGLDPEATVVPQETVDKETPGGTIGILGAPEALPERSDFITTGWTACTADGAGIAVGVARTPGVRTAAGTGMVVSTGHDEWLIAESTSPDGTTTQAYRYRLPHKANALVQLIFAPTVPTVEHVSQDWVNLFPEGTSLGADGFSYAGYGGSTDLVGEPGVPGDTRVGDIATYDGDPYLVLRDGWVRLTEFQAAVYEGTPHHGVRPHQVTFDELPNKESATRLPTTHWPDRRPAPGAAVACAQLHAGADEEATVRLATAANGSTAWPEKAPRAGHAPEVTVSPGKGSFFYVGSGTTTKGLPAYIVDSRGTANLIEGASTLATLGLDDYAAPVVPDTWVKLFGKGTALSTELALCPPGTKDEKGGSCAPAAG